MQLALRASNRPLAVSMYALGSLTPEMCALLPTEEDLTRVAQEVLDGGGR
ncbi:hypothetical protein [Streptomyces sp. NPDC051684]